MASSRKNKFMGVLDDVSDAATSSDSEGEALDRGEGAKRQKKQLSLEDLEKAGYKSAPSVLFVKPPADEGQTSWNWSDGRAAKGQGGGDERDALQERKATRHAVEQGVKESAAFSAKALAHAAALREAARAEREALAAEKRLSFNQKEKRKRAAGQASRVGSYVEEEKRAGRSLGMYSGFD